MPKLKIFLAASLVLLGLLPARPAAAEVKTVEMPLTLDWGLVRSFLIRQMFHEPGQRAVVLDDGQNCNRIELWDPQPRAAGEFMLLKVRLRVRAGLVILGECRQPVDWAGSMELKQRVWLDYNDWQVRVQTVASQLLDAQGQPATVANLVYQLVKDHVHAYLDQFRVDLTFPRQELAQALPLVFPPHKEQEVKDWLTTLRLDKLRVEPTGLVAPLLMEVYLPSAPEPTPTPRAEPTATPSPAATAPAPAEAAAPSPPESPASATPPPEAEPTAVTPAEVTAFTNYWQTWDSYLVWELLSLQGLDLTPAERNLLLTTLLEARYRFVDALTQPSPPGRDLVRRLFLETWQKLAPVLRRHLLDQPSPSLLNYLAFFTATDALAALDRLGPDLGLDISQEGLARLARLLAQGGAAVSLAPSDQVNPRLREVLGLGAPLPEEGPALPEEDLEYAPTLGPPGPPQPRHLTPAPDQGWLRFLWGPAAAWAAPAAGEKDLEEIRRWLPPKQELEPYLSRVREVLDQAVQAVLGRDETLSGLGPVFPRLAAATAWQESCWRQFVVKNSRLTYLKSYNNTSVGLMQVNMYAWRDIYRLDSLRWNIRYNAQAGAEILAQYLVRYVWPRRQELAADKLPHAVYALYNGGPAQLGRYLRDHKKGRLWQSDRLFAEKLSWVRAQQFEQAAGCLLGR
ncbi:MAG: lytic transglycosylase domain-containing protein [Deltaproteobacteria bacterium]|nr:lytic transglycosylase domain-containing protein [Deltaproteobacteria bacterium]